MNFISIWSCCLFSFSIRLSPAIFYFQRNTQMTEISFILRKAGGYIGQCRGLPSLGRVLPPSFYSVSQSMRIPPGSLMSNLGSRASSSNKIIPRPPRGALRLLFFRPHAANDALSASCWLASSADRRSGSSNALEHPCVVLAMVFNFASISVCSVMTMETLFATSVTSC